MTAALDRQLWDLVICDYVLPGFGGMEALELFKQRSLEAPFIVVSGHIGEDVAVAAIKAGADDYLMKDRLARLVPAVERALEAAEVRRAHKRSDAERRFAQEQLAANATQLECTVAELRQREGELCETNGQLTRARAELETRVQERTAELMKANWQLQRQMKERKRLENELLEIAEKERRRIGFDLHDDIGQKLMGVGLLLKALDIKLSQKQLPEASESRNVLELLDQVVNRTNDLANCFNSLEADNQDLGQLLRELIVNVRKTFPLKCSLRIRSLPALSQDATMQLCKIAQESVTHAIKYGKAHRVWISLARSTDHLRLRIKNDGTPFATDCEPTNQLGVQIMNYRARTLGGTLEMQKQGEAGSVIICTVPLSMVKAPPPAPPRVARPEELGNTAANGSNAPKPRVKPGAIPAAA